VGEWDIGRVGTLIKGIYNRMNGALFPKSEHFLERLRHIFVASLTPAVVMCLVVAGEYVATGIRTSRELDKEMKEGYGGISCRHLEIQNKNMPSKPFGPFVS